jgi:hypothetical protein
MSIRTIEETAGQSPLSDLVAFEAWLSSINRTTVTGWRWRKLGWIEVINIAGRSYISRAAIAWFEAAAAAGRFARVHPTPGGKEKSS